MKKRSILLIIVLLANNILVMEWSYKPTKAWGLVTHQYILENAMENVSEEWQEAFTYYKPELISGCTYPDQVLQDWENHLYYPETEEYNGPWHINNTIYGIQSNITMQEDWETIFLLLGILSHYVADLNIPVHTGPIWGGDVDESNGHSAYETDINNHLDNVSTTISNFEPVLDPVTFMIERATVAHESYWDIRNAYPTGNEYGIIETNQTIKNITETQLGNAAGSIRVIWEYTLKDFTPPEVEVRENIAKILVDKYHDNDYAEGDLTSFVDTLNRDVVEATYNEMEITSTVLFDVDLLVITAPYESYFTPNEISAISSWYKTGGNILMSSRGDYENVNHTAINELLKGIDSYMRVNDDNVYTTPADPDYYKDWYCKTDEFETTSEVGENITGELTQKIQFFSPSSLYNSEDNTLVNWIIYGEETFYQTDQNEPPPEVLFDNTDDNVGGTAIPLAGIEETDDSTIALFGSTIWSDFDFGLADKDNKALIWNTVEYLLNIDLEINNNGKEPTDDEGDEETTKTPYVNLILILSTLSVTTVVFRSKR